jgi:hypothetical protein
MNSVTELDGEEECKRVYSSKFPSNRSTRCYERQRKQAQFRNETGQGARRYLEAAADHAVDGVVAAAADAHHLYPRRLHRRERAPGGRAAGPPVVPPPASWRCAEVGGTRKADEGGSRGGGSSGRGHGHSLPSLAKCCDGEARGGRGKRGWDLVWSRVLRIRRV